MKTLLALLLLSTSVAAKTHIIRLDTGGYVRTYVEKYDAWAANGDTVILDGVCWSACTYITRVPNACATEGSILVFHEAFYPRDGYRATTSIVRERTLYLYPPKVQREFIHRGGLSPKWLYIRATDLMPECKG